MCAANLKTDRLYLRAVSIDDKESIFEYRSDAETNKYQGWIPRNIEDVEHFIGSISAEINVPETWFQFVIIECETDTLIGDIGVHFIDTDNRQVELGCTLRKNRQGNGFAAEALERVIDYLFSDLKKHRIVTSIDPGNAKSIKLVERLGFRKEAHFIGSLLINGKWVDDVVYAILEREWRNDNHGTSAADRQS